MSEYHPACIRRAAGEATCCDARGDQSVAGAAPSSNQLPSSRRTIIGSSSGSAGRSPTIDSVALDLDAVLRTLDAQSLLSDNDRQQSHPWRVGHASAWASAENQRRVRNGAGYRFEIVDTGTATLPKCAVSEPARISRCLSVSVHASDSSDCDRTVISQAENPDEHRDLRTHIA